MKKKEIWYLKQDPDSYWPLMKTHYVSKHATCYMHNAEILMWFRKLDSICFIHNTKHDATHNYM